MARSFARIALAAASLCLAATVSAKLETQVTPPPADDDVLHQGGDTFADALLIPDEPFVTTGTTAGYTDDYDEACPYTQSTSPDVVYRFSPRYHTWVNIDLLGSDYDTKVYVYGAGMDLVACNDDYHADYTSRIEALELLPMVKYYIVVDGYGGDFGDYRLDLHTIPPGQGEVVCEESWPLEGEPPLVDGYVDAHNGGCTNPEQGLNFIDLPFSAAVCATSGWFTGGRDHDWYRGDAIGIYDSFEVYFEVEMTTRVTVYRGADCAALEVAGTTVVGPLEEGYLWVGASGDEEMWVEVHPEAELAPPGFTGEFDYFIMQMFPVGEPPVAVEARNWSSVKRLFD